MNVYEVDYSIKDMEKYKEAPKEVPNLVVAEDFNEAVKVARNFEDDNLALHKCNLALTGKAALQKKLKGIEPTKAAT